MRKELAIKFKELIIEILNGYSEVEIIFSLKSRGGVKS
jgi:hypothetical protein